jgi:hypothetical protein
MLAVQCFPYLTRVRMPRKHELACQEPVQTGICLRTYRTNGPFKRGRQCSSVVEQRFRKPSVAGSIPAIGSTRNLF